MTARTRSALNAPMLLTEKAWQRLVVDAAQALGWHVHHHYDSRRSEPGFPDLVLLRPPEALFIELKTDVGKVTPAQIEFLDRLRRCNLETHIWRPSDEARAFSRLARKPTLEHTS